MAQPKISVDLILSKLAEEAEKAGESAQKASDVLLESLETKIAVTPYDVVYEEDRVKLKHYKPTVEIQLKRPLLIVYALINRETMLDLQPGRSVVQNFLQEGIDVYMIDWGYPARKDKYLTIDDHVNGYMDNIVDFILDKHNLDKIHLMGICMGGTFCVIYSALHPEKIKNMVTTVTPTNFDTNQGLLHIWMKDMDVDRIVDTYGNIPGDIMNMGFLLLNPARLMIDKYVGFIENMANKKFVENFVRMEKWIFDSPDVPGETFRQFVRDCYQKNLLIQSKMEVGGKRVDLKKITMPLLNYYGKYDHLVPPEACELLTGKVGSKDTEDICLDTGHIGIYVSSKYQKEFVPRIARWLKERDEDKKKRGAKKATAKKRVAKKTPKKTAALKTKKKK
ncbi:MAG: class III poly(R)-hydroxyalkanoic acid synthase subunit PhaC [Deltaproteobacteria bacterium]|jgi:polyhydroxyalkanoate synthase|nr:class III poly(R)-hydroxyalkanoic acid synthase subunit PhaC [Deltaproteobacteria bacterium]MBW1747232.1 class III poly(R)-hydroxyalkanoic acid synthase subunit PhaC [Deltaproteobacteria bacterium]MBW1826143.1 class III poly(R)-hydroxyalkanoic acid synthase subunit PhaC [Deltaproteobacteria bacterium]MBW1969653.1 class III poly(R)-hydroxyalkanoic acid synthase subunit PhaC [Deltaproteobacteria bacterium]MBW2197538.1 class III poly(R)-hydroxyalkanoic acid synthase subunit PhaC [Deltaproteobac